MPIGIAPEPLDLLDNIASYSSTSCSYFAAHFIAPANDLEADSKLYIRRPPRALLLGNPSTLCCSYSGRNSLCDVPSFGVIADNSAVGAGCNNNAFSRTPALPRLPLPNLSP